MGRVPPGITAPGAHSASAPRAARADPRRVVAPGPDIGPSTLIEQPNAGIADHHQVLDAQSAPTEFGQIAPGLRQRRHAQVIDERDVAAFQPTMALAHPARHLPPRVVVA